MSNALITALKKNPTLENIEDSHLEFILKNAEIENFQKGDSVFKAGEAADTFLFVLKGRIRIYFTQNDQQREVAILEPYEISGVLPYSRMTHAQGSAVALEPVELISLHRSFFREMIVDHHQLAEALVHHMASRIRTFTKRRMQDEKLMSLGKLSAGLAHELNNPAAAMVRSSEALSKHLKLLPDGFKRVMNAKLDPDLVDKVNDWLFELLENPPVSLSLMERGELEDQIADQLEDCGVEDPFELAEDLVEYNISAEDLKKLCSMTGKHDFETVIRWVANNMSTDRMVKEINASAERISKLIGSIKEYSHMDRDRDRQEVDINHGLQSTLTMLKHKAKANKVQVDEHFDQNIPHISGFPGELNQVWTNIIDNAFDAMEKDGGVLTIKTEWCEPFVKVHITDTGVGIPEEIKDKIFDPFFTTKEIGKGTGLGLDIVNRVISQHRATVEIQSKPGKTHFEISLPARENK